MISISETFNEIITLNSRPCKDHDNKVELYRANKKVAHKIEVPKQESKETNKMLY